MKKVSEYESPRRIHNPALSFTVTLVILVLLLFILIPLFSILKGSFFGDDGVFSFRAYRQLFHDAKFITAFTNTMKLGIVVGFTSTIVGFLFAYVKQCVRSLLLELVLLRLPESSLLAQLSLSTIQECFVTTTISAPHSFANL